MWIITVGIEKFLVGVYIKVKVEKESDSSAVAMVHEALLAAEVNSKGLQAKLQMVVNAGESSIENIFAKQQLSFTILEQPDINGYFW